MPDTGFCIRYISFIHCTYFNSVKDEHKNSCKCYARIKPQKIRSLILEDYWKKNPALQSIPIYHNARVATKALEVYRTYINMMNETIRRDNRKANPWKFDYIYPLHSSLIDQHCKFDCDRILIFIPSSSSGDYGEPRFAC